MKLRVLSVYVSISEFALGCVEPENLLKIVLLALHSFHQLSLEFLLLLEPVIKHAFFCQDYFDVTWRSLEFVVIQTLVSNIKCWDQILLMTVFFCFS